MVEFLRRNGFADIELVKSSGGAFEIKADGCLLYSKKQTGRFPQNDEILGKLKRIGNT
ncbi:MAG: SelT/SelW/SelH family protein [Calditrichaeota bacterium]|nr:SelT/SelW/SelH family protein [Calditrichota bacterium]